MFQYPLSGRVWWSDADNHCLMGHPHVSVPSVGSGLVELMTDFSKLKDTPKFQYPLSGRVWWSSCKRPGLLLAQMVFQYPLSGRVWWSAVVLTADQAQLCFSTLCRVGFGGAPLWRRIRRTHRRFSTLCRVGFGGATAVLISSAARSRFSTLCRVGFGGAPLIPRVVTRVDCFSTLCRVGFGGAATATIMVDTCSCFSTLCRVGFGGAVKNENKSKDVRVFQYPLSGRVWWSTIVGCAWRCLKPFQYPLSGRVWWSMAGVSSVPSLSGFSTLCRVGFGGAKRRCIACWPS